MARVTGGGSPIASEIYVAADSLRAGGKPVAIKRLASSVMKNPEKRDPYVAVAQDVAKRLRHPNLVEIKAVGADGSDVYLVMEYLHGETLARFLRELHRAGQTLQTSTAAYIVAEACAGLDAAHRAGVVHGHLTPYDLFIGYDGTVKVLDVGLAEAKVAAVSEGEIAQVRDIEIQYSSPEVCRGQSADKRSDVFSLGAILWELLTGVSPFERAERAATMRAICEEAIAAPGSIRRDAVLPGRMSETTMEALVRDPEKRCPDAGKLRQLLLGHVGADKPARTELGRLLSTTFERRKADKAKLVALATKNAPAAEYANLDLTDDPMGLEALEHGADLDAKSPSGIAPPTGGAVTAGPKVVVHRPQSDPSMRTTHPVGDAGRERKLTAPLTPPLGAPPAADSTPSAKPPRVPFYDASEEERRRRQEPTSLVARPPGQDPSGITPPPQPLASTPAPRKKIPILAILAAALLGVAATLVVLFVLRAKPKAHAMTEPAASASPIVASAPPPIEPVPIASASASVAPVAPPASAAALERTVLSIDTIPTRATIVVNGETKGKTPLDLKLPKSNEEVVIELQHAGYATMKERVVPDVNQRLKLTLVPSGGATTTPVGAKPAKPAKPAATNPYRKFE